LVYFGVISVMVCCTKKNLATLDLFFAEFWISLLPTNSEATKTQSKSRKRIP
jgi:hypothetical protein